jgi:hypothetical protein
MKMTDTQRSGHEILQSFKYVKSAAHTPGPIDRDSIYWSKERYRIIPQTLGPMSIQYLLIDTFENEIVGTHPQLSDAMAQRDQLDPVV